MILKMVLSFIKNFIVKYLGSLAIEKIIVLLLGELVKRTDSDVDDKIYDIVFNKVKKEEEEKEQQ